MAYYLLKRLATLIATLWATSAIIFLVLEILPGDPALLALGIDASSEQLVAFRVQYGLDRPPLERYLDWLGHLLHGDFGISYAYKTRSEEHTSELQSLMRISYAVFCLKKKNAKTNILNNLRP